MEGKKRHGCVVDFASVCVCAALAPIEFVWAAVVHECAIAALVQRPLNIFTVLRALNSCPMAYKLALEFDPAVSSVVIGDEHYVSTKQGRHIVFVRAKESMKRLVRQRLALLLLVHEISRPAC